ncbi:enoyl-CoA hydratase [Rhodococcus coprophilus]|uniref:Enoyl-CoA hydratase n=1 Tax=Rhodococcus coprophilus TaxID=38310 RepID=A0A2X4U0F4_9NOCA|nr:enoyl-CoA hydratase [Rhodococcus coprophilus]MBM7458704.1 enoyl-CoA hydratase [Rhodococcus coprophilus]SQI33246.1 enoyl-CoA hydratase [Rhodococcus coprophilus]
MTTEAPGVESRIDDGILHVTIDRPARLNAVGTATLTAVAEAFDKCADDPTVRAAVLTGSGRAFCSGADISGRDLSAPPAPDTIDAANRVTATIRDFPRPVVGAVNGVTAGVGVSLALACDLTVAKESAYFLLAFTRIGLMPDGGATALVAASIGRARAMRMAMLAERLPAREALASGLIADVYPDDGFDDAVGELLTRLAAGPSAALASTKEAINAATLTELGSAFGRERAGQLDLLAGADFAEGVAAFQEKRTAEFRR